MFEKEPEEKKLKWTDLKIGDVIRGKVNKIEYMVIGIYRDKATDEHILIPHSDWLSDEQLLEFEKVEE